MGTMALPLLHNLDAYLSNSPSHCIMVELLSALIPHVDRIHDQRRKAETQPIGLRLRVQY